MVKERINALGERFYRRKLMDLKIQHQAEKDQLENEFQKELNDCNGFWEKKIEDYNGSSQTLQDELHQKHQEILEKYENDLDKTMPQTGKMTPEIINLKYQIKKLVKDQRYKEAHALQKKADELTSKCMKKNDSIINSKKEHKVTFKLQKQEYEMQALCYKIDTGREELIKAREKDYQKLVSKYRVLREKLDDQQIMDYHRQEKVLRNFKPSSKNFNRSMRGESIQKF